MIRFKLFDENDESYDDENTPYVLNLDFEDGENDFDEWANSNPSFDAFMEKMETSNASWSGVHDGTGGTDKDGIVYLGFSSYEITDFPKAISMWADFFRKHGKLIEKPRKKLVKESMEDRTNDFGEIHIWAKSSPRSDRKILDLLKQIWPEYASYAGGIGGSGMRVFVIDDPEATVEEVSDVLAEYIEKGMIKSVDYL